MDKYLTQSFTLLFKFVIFLTFLLARTFMGVNIFGFRLGEYFIGFSFILLITSFVFLPIYRKSFVFNFRDLNIAILCLLTAFLLSIAVNLNNLTNLEVFKTSSYIWSLGALTFGFIIANKINFKISYSDIFLSCFALLVIYVFSTRGISENLQNYLLQFTDKFEYPKGSDLLLAFVFVLLLILNKLNFSFLSLNILAFTFSLYAPLLMVKSRSAFISSILFLLLLIPSFSKKIKIISTRTAITLFLSSLIFILSTSWVVSRDLVVDEEISNELKYAITSRYSSINDNVYENEYLQLSLFYFDNGRIFSTDGNLNWRFQIWQDVFSDMLSPKLFIFGYGYENIIPAMDSDQRYGQDKQNVNVHNYFVHIFSRGGLFSLFCVLYIYYLLYKLFKRKNLQLEYLQISVPLLFNSLFDPCMENAHYPVIFYILLGLTFSKSIILEKEQNS